MTSGSEPIPAAVPGLPSRWWWGALLLGITLLAYGPAYKAGFIWDDPDHVVTNQCLRTADGLRQIWFDVGATPQYYPLVFSSFWVEYQLWGVEPQGYHTVNVVLHALGAIVLWRVLLRLRMPGAWLAAAVFALHPVHVESVAWITERKNTLSALMYLLSALAYVRFAGLDRGDMQASSCGREWRWYIAAFALFGCALWSKTVTCSLPAALLVITWWKTGRLRWRDVLPTLPMFAIGFAAGMLTAWFEKRFIWGAPPEVPYSLPGAYWEIITGQWAGGVSDYHYTLIERFLIAGRVVWFYAASLLWPANLVFSYEKWNIDAHDVTQWLYPAAAAAVVLGLWLARKRLGRGPLAAVLYFGGTLFPAMGFFDVYPFRFSFVADHFQHLASLGVTTLVCACAAVAVDRAGSTWRRASVAAAGVLMVVLAVLTARQCRAYQDENTLWRDTIARNPQSWLAHANLAVLLYNQQQYDEAMSLSQRALEIRPNLPLAHVNIGNIHMARNATALAEAEYLTALELEPDNVDAHNNLGAILSNRGGFDAAQVHLERAIQRRPKDGSIRMNLAVLHVRMNHMELAMAEYRRALSINPNFVDSVFEMARFLFQSGRLTDALAHCDLALEYRSDWREVQAMRERIIARLNAGSGEPHGQ